MAEEWRRAYARRGLRCKNMASDKQTAFYHSREWKQCRKAYAASVNGLCEDCLRRGIINAGKVVHHIRWIDTDNLDDTSVTLDWNNLVMVCQDCHAKRHSDGGRIAFDAEGRVVCMR